MPVREVSSGIQGEWERLVKFLKESVLLSAACDLVGPAELAKYAIQDFVPLLQTNASDIVATGEGIKRIKGKLQDRDEQPHSLGWPIITFSDESGELKSAPIFVATVTVELSQDENVLLTRQSVFTINPSLDKTDGIGQIFADAIEGMEDTLTPEDLVQIVKETSEILGLPRYGFEDSAPIPNGEAIEAIVNAATLIAGDSAATTYLIQELDILIDRKDWQGTAAAGLVTGHAEQILTSNSLLPLIAPLIVNYAQEEVLKACPTSSVTVVTGPPGTGKSQVVVNLVADAWMHDNSILLVSTNNAAVDVAAERANEVSPGLLLRTGNRNMRDQLPEVATQLFSRARKMDPSVRAIAQAAISTTTMARVSYHACLDRHSLLGNRLHSTIQSEMDLLETLQAFGEIPTSDIDTEQLLQSLDRFLKFNFLRKLRWRIFSKRNSLPRTTNCIEPLRLWLRQTCANADYKREIIGLEIVLGDVNTQMETVDTQWRNSCATYVGSLVSDTIARNRASMDLLGQAIGHHGGVARVTAEVLDAARGWACTTLSLKQNFPLQVAMFDYVIVDEASQCQLAYVLPAAYRAKRLVVVGDPNQLPPIVNMDAKQEESLAAHNGLDFQTLEKRKITSVNYSAYDFFANLVGSDNVKLLNEHYRSHPEIARWFNESFYSSALKVLTDISSFDAEQRSIVWVDVVGNAEQPQNGASWLNRAEADKALELIGQLLEVGKTIGVVTPFKAQAERIRVMAQRKFSRELLHQARFKSSTAHGFQGDERDVMIFSCVLADGVSPRAARWIQSERRLINVAVSRARERLVILGAPFISRYECATLTSLQEFVRTVHEVDNNKIGVRFDSNAEKLLFESLISAGVAPLSKFNVEGYELDFGLLTVDGRYDIEVDGDHHYESTVGHHLRLRRQDITKDRILSRAGWTVIRVPAWECVSDSASVAQRILNIVQGTKPEKERLLPDSCDMPEVIFP